MQDRATVQQTQKRPVKKKKKKVCSSSRRRLGTDLELATLLSFRLHFFHLSGGGIRKGDPLSYPPAPGNSAAVSPLLGFNIYL